MRLLNTAVAVTSALVGSLGAAAAYGALNTAPVGYTEPPLEPVRLTHYLPCEPPSVLKNGVCVTTVIETVVKTAEPIVITTVEKTRSPKGKPSSTAKSHTDDKGDHEDEDEGDDEGGHDQEHGED